MFRSPRHVMSGSPARRLQTELADLQQSKAPRRWPLCQNFVLPFGPLKKTLISLFNSPQIILQAYYHLLVTVTSRIFYGKTKNKMVPESMWFQNIPSASGMWCPRTRQSQIWSERRLSCETSGRLPWRMLMICLKINCRYFSFTSTSWNGWYVSFLLLFFLFLLVSSKVLDQKLDRNPDQLDLSQNVQENGVLQARVIALEVRLFWCFLFVQTICIGEFLTSNHSCSISWWMHFWCFRTLDDWSEYVAFLWL